MASAAINRIYQAEDRPDEMIGAKRGLRQVWDAVQLVAQTDSTVLIQGETGTGKELVAEAIHRESCRNRGPCVKLNCAAMPAGLLESELFGHERGAFTGAVSQFAGRFQLANGGTLFLDEIGDMPLELQPKLLRVLQDREFDRLGSSRTVRVDVRIVAATNQNLRQMVRDRRFRMDLFYRLNVYPITLPPLRERTQDIPLLVNHFVKILARPMKRTFAPISDDTMKILQQHPWSGNVRELENFVHRAVISSPGPNLMFPMGDLTDSTVGDVPSPSHTLAEAERAHILRVLQKVGGKVGGTNGAAARLGVARTTLIYRMRKLGIENELGAPVTS